MAIPQLAENQSPTGGSQVEAGGEHVVQPDFTLLLSVLMGSEHDNAKPPSTGKGVIVRQLDTVRGGNLPEFLVEAEPETTSTHVSTGEEAKENDKVASDDQQDEISYDALHTQA